MKKSGNPALNCFGAGNTARKWKGGRVFAELRVIALKSYKKGGSFSQTIRYVVVTWAVIFTCPGSIGVGTAACVFMSAAPTLAFS